MIKYHRLNPLLLVMKQTVKALKRDSVKEIVVAKDADPALTASVMKLAQEKGVDILVVDSMKSTGKACGIEVGAAAVAIML